MPRKVRKKVGLPPGSIVFTGKKKVDTIQLSYLEYNPTICNETNLSNQTISKFHQPVAEFIQWYDVRGLHDTELIKNIGETFSIHTLVLEDIADPAQRPKFEEYNTGIAIILKALKFDTEQSKVITEQVSIFLGDGFVLSFQEDETDLFVAIRTRLTTGKGQIRTKGADYLTYALIDCLMDNYFIVLDNIEEQIESIEKNILESKGNNNKGQIHQLKQEMLIVRKAISPLREANSRFSKSEHHLIESDTKKYVRDLYDHNVHLMDTVDTYRDMLTSLQELYLSEISFKMNQVMQVLTLITTIFVPLSFLAGLYGMNFEYIPELKFKYGYFLLLFVMFCMVVGLLIYFKKKKWF